MKQAPPMDSRIPTMSDAGEVVCTPVFLGCLGCNSSQRMGFILDSLVPAGLVKCCLRCRLLVFFHSPEWPHGVLFASSSGPAL